MKAFGCKNHHIFARLTILMLGLVLSSCIVEPDHDYAENHRYSASEDFLYRIDAGTRMEFRLNAVSGSVEITGIAGLNQVKIWGEKIVESDSRSDAKDHLAYLSVVPDSSENAVSARTNQPSRSDGRNYIVHYHVQVPRDWMIVAEQVNGDIRVSSIRGNVTITSENGKVYPDSLDTSLLVSIVNGSLVMKDLHCSITGAIVNGVISGDLALPLNGNCILSTTNGTISIAIPDTTSALFTAKTVNGTVSVSGLTLQDLQSSIKSVSGRLGAGEGTMTLSAVNGSIVVSGMH